MNENSLKAYYTGTFSGRFSAKRFEVLKFITEHPNYTRQQISLQMSAGNTSDYGINIICGRVKELIDAGLIVDSKETPRGRLKSLYVDKDKDTVLKGHVMPSGVAE